MISEALHYLNDYGWSVYPCRDKAPILRWKRLQTDLPTESEIRDWWTRWPDAQIGMSPRDIFIIDIDVGHDPEDLRALELPPTVIVGSPSGGRHVYLKNPDDTLVVKNRVGLFPHVDVRAQGGNIILPPSLGPGGRRYEWLVSPEDAEIAVASAKTMTLLAEQRIRADYGKISLGTVEGRRNQSAASIVGCLLHYLPTDTWTSLCWPLLEAWNGRNDPPLPDAELERTFVSIAEAELKRRGAVKSV